MFGNDLCRLFIAFLNSAGLAFVSDLLHEERCMQSCRSCPNAVHTIADPAARVEWVSIWIYDDGGLRVFLQCCLLVTPFCPGSIILLFVDII